MNLPTTREKRDEKSAQLMAHKGIYKIKIIDAFGNALLSHFPVIPGLTRNPLARSVAE